MKWKRGLRGSILLFFRHFYIFWNTAAASGQFPKAPNISSLISKSTWSLSVGDELFLQGCPSSLSFTSDVALVSFRLGVFSFLRCFECHHWAGHLPLSSSELPLLPRSAKEKPKVENGGNKSRPEID